MRNAGGKRRCLGWEFLFLLKMFIHPGSMLIFRGVIILVATSASWKGKLDPRNDNKRTAASSRTPQKQGMEQSQILESGLVLGLMWW